MEFSINEYTEYKEEEVINLYESVGWTNYTSNQAMLKHAYQNSLKIYAAYENNHLIGIIRVVGDAYSIVFIQDLIVLPNYQHQGIGTSLVKAILEQYKDVYQKSLMTEDTEKTIAFYKSVGFEQVTDVGCTAFMKMF